MIRRQCDNHLTTVFRGNGIVLCIPAFLASVHDILFPPFQIQTRRLHEPSAGSGTVSRVYVYMLAIETLRAMIGIAGAGYIRPAFFAHKIFFYSPKCGAHT
jgi:hypothetical protein